MSDERPPHDVIDPPDFEAAEVKASGLATKSGEQIDQLIRFARKYPRSIKQFNQKATSMATQDEQVAIACMYALPRKGKTIQGASVRLAEIIAHSWGNLATEAFVTGMDARFITARANVWDLETNVTIGFEVRRRLTDKYGATVNDDMITQTANAAASIAFRNSVLKCVPFPCWNPIYESSRRTAVGTEKTLAHRRAVMLDLAVKSGVSRDRVFAALDVKGEEDIDLEKLLVARAAFEAVKNNELRLDTAFPPIASYLDPSDDRPKNERLADRLSRSRDTPKASAKPEEPEPTESEDAADFAASIAGDLPDPE